MAADAMGMVPIIYSAKVLRRFYATTRTAAISNTIYEAEVKGQGDTVIIPRDPTITISTHRKGMNLSYEQPESTPATLLIDDGRSWAFSTNPIDDAQTHVKDYAARWTAAAGRDLAVSVDQSVLQNVYTDVDASNTGATAGAISGDINLGVDAGTSREITTANVLDVIVECGQVLSEQNIPEEGRWMVVPQWFKTRVLLSDLKDASLAGDGESIVRNGRMGRIGDFTLYWSNNLATTTDGASDTATHILFGTREAITFAAQITQNQVIDNPNAFGKLHRGLMVYGFTVTQPTALGDLYAKAA
jgi:hypothetical protein